MSERKMMELLCEEMLERGYDAQPIDIPKNNRVMPAVCIRNGNTGVNFYPSSFSSIDLPVSFLADEVEKRLGDLMSNAPDTSMLNDPEFVISHLEVRICKEDWNEKRLSGAVTRRLYETDLVLYLMVVVNLHLEGCGSFIVQQDYLNGLGISEDEAWNAALSNLHPEVSDLEKVLGIKIGGPDNAGNYHPYMVVISNSEKYNGAAAIAGKKALDKASKMLGCERIYIIPSSIHECLAVPSETAFPDMMRDMICEINEGIVSETERLSDHPYLWDGKELTSAGTVQMQGVS